MTADHERGELWSIQPTVINDLPVSGLILKFWIARDGEPRLSIYRDAKAIVNNRDIDFTRDGVEAGRGSGIGPGVPGGEA